jgi:hypothetical protein
MKNEPLKLPMRKLIDFMESRAQDPVSTTGKNFFEELLDLAAELEVEELAMIGDAHYDGMAQMKEIMEQQELLPKTDEYIMDKYSKMLPSVDISEFIQEN